MVPKKLKTLVVDKAYGLFLPLMGHEQTLLISLGAFTGLMVAFGGIGFSYLLNFIQVLCYEGRFGIEHMEGFSGAVARMPDWMILVLPALGGLIVGPLVTRYAREARGHGIPEVIQAQTLKGGRIRKRVALIKIFASAISIGTGGSAGKEGPVVQIGAAAGSGIGQFLNLSRPRMRTLVGCGAAAGIATVFNAPIAGVIFSAEIIMGSFEASSFAAIVVSAVIATVTSQALMGNVALLRIAPEIADSYTLVSPFEVLTYVGLGIAAAGIAILYIRSISLSETIFEKLKAIPEWVRPALGGLLVGVIGLKFPQVMAQGFDSLHAVLDQDFGKFTSGASFPWLFLLGLLFFKMIATSLTIGSGGSGGVFAPSLFLGAMLGAVYGAGVNLLFPTLTAGPGAYALVGMGAVVSGITAAPISAILILFELTNNYRIILPLMLSAVIATVIVSQIMKASIYTLKLKKRGIVLHQGRDQTILQNLLVNDCMRKEILTLSENTKFSALLRQVIKSPRMTFPVVDGKQKFIGSITFEDLKEHLLDPNIGDVLIARDLMKEKNITVSPGDSLLTALDRFGKTDQEELPVLDPQNEEKLLGVLSKSDVLKAYHRALSEKGEQG